MTEKDFIKAKIGTTGAVGVYEWTRIPGGLLFQFYEDNYSGNNDKRVVVTDTFVPLNTLKKTLEQL